MKERKLDTEDKEEEEVQIESSKLQGKNSVYSTCLNCNSQLIEKEKLLMMIEGMNSKLMNRIGSIHINSSKAVAEGFTMLLNKINTLDKEKSYYQEEIEKYKNNMYLIREQSILVNKYILKDKHQSEKEIDDLRYKLSNYEEKLNTQYIENNMLVSNITNLQNEIMNFQVKIREYEIQNELLKKDNKTNNDKYDSYILEVECL